MAAKQDYGCFKILLIAPFLVAVDYLVRKQNFIAAINLAVAAYFIVAIAHSLLLMFLIGLKPINEP